MGFAEVDAWVAAKLGDRCIQCGGKWYPPVGPMGNKNIPRGYPCGRCASMNRCGCRATGRHCCEHPRDCDCGAKEPRLPYGHRIDCAYVKDSCAFCRDDEEYFDE